MSPIRRLIQVFGASLMLLMMAAPSSSSTPTGWTPDALKGLDGAELPASTVKGKVVLIVNVASFCGFTPQYSGLQALYHRYKDRGLVVLGVPCNQFGSQEPGSAEEIRSFCSSRYGVDFPLLSKQDVNGAQRSPLYAWLVDSKVGGGKDVGWNFEKFLVDRQGVVIGRFGSHVVPLDPTLVAAIEFALGP